MHFFEQLPITSISTKSTNPMVLVRKNGIGNFKGLFYGVGVNKFVKHWKLVELK